MSIRLARLEDLKAMLMLERAVPEAPHWSAEGYRAALMGERVRRRVFVWEDGSVLGFAVGAVTDAGEIESVVVAPEARRRGIGRRLCADVIGWCRQEGAREVMLEVRESSRGAIALYESLGFKKLGHRKDYYRNPLEDGAMMGLPLS